VPSLSALLVLKQGRCCKKKRRRKKRKKRPRLRGTLGIKQTGKQMQVVHRQRELWCGPGRFRGEGTGGVQSVEADCVGKGVGQPRLPFYLGLSVTGDDDLHSPA